MPWNCQQKSQEGFLHLYAMETLLSKHQRLLGSSNLQSAYRKKQILHSVPGLETFPAQVFRNVQDESSEIWQIISSSWSLFAKEMDKDEISIVTRVKTCYNFEVNNLLYFDLRNTVAK